MIFTITNTINIDVNEIYDDWKEHSFDGQALNSCIEQAMDYNLDDMEVSEEDEKISLMESKSFTPKVL